MKENDSDASVVHVLKGKLEESLKRGCHFNHEWHFFILYINV